MRRIEQAGLTLIRLTDAAPPPADWAYAFPAHAEAAEDPALLQFAPDGRFHTAFAVHAVIGPEFAVLVDAGIGPGPVAYFGGMEGRLDRELAALGVAPKDVTAVMLTHLHLDHVGWASRNGQACFPRARYFAPAAELDHWRQGAEAALPHHVAAFNDHIAPLLAQGRLLPLQDGEPAPDAGGLRFHSVPGHTVGHAAVTTGDGKLIVAGDAWHSPAQIARPHWCHRADRDPARAIASRMALARLAAGQRALVAAGHFPEEAAFGHILPAEGGGFRWQAADR